MNADGRERKRLVTKAAKEEDGCPLDFHPNGREIIYYKRGSGLWTVDVADGMTRKLDLPATYTGEPCLSADGTRMAARNDNDLYAIDLVRKTHHKYAQGCSPNVSPDGRRLMNNTGGHRQIVIRNWDGSGEFRIDTRTMRPDREWDDHHWSNHNDYLMTNGEGSREEAYVIKISENRVTRVTWEGDARFPDLCVAKAAPGAVRAPSAGGSGMVTSGRRATAQGRAVSRKPAPEKEKLVIEARLVETTKVPSLQALQDYAHCLVLYKYQVKEVVEGAYDLKEILVYHWAIRDRKPVRALRQKKKGATYRLALDRWEDHPELESERQIADIEEGDLPLFYDAGRRAEAAER
jgi:hypothetical protein